jgi:hypothetical protein
MQHPPPFCDSIIFQHQLLCSRHPRESEIPKSARGYQQDQPQLPPTTSLPRSHRQAHTDRRYHGQDHEQDQRHRPGAHAAIPARMSSTSASLGSPPSPRGKSSGRKWARAQVTCPTLRLRYSGLAENRRRMASSIFCRRARDLQHNGPAAASRSASQRAYQLRAANKAAYRGGGMDRRLR